MFTGLIEEVGSIRRVERWPEGARLAIGASKVLEGTDIGDSIAVSGACLTVTAVRRDEFVAECMAETLTRTTLGGMTAGVAVNLERALALSGRMGGHLVLGHVDAVATVRSIEARGDALEIALSLPAGVARFVAEKGSVALDGVSLTVMRAGAEEFSVGLIEHTISATTLRSLAKGSKVNLEADVLARYVYRSMQANGDSSDGEVVPSEGLTLELLREKGFV
jgi:riboflavin synthase